MKAPFAEKITVTCKPGICRHQHPERIGPRINCWEPYRSPVPCGFYGNEKSCAKFAEKKVG